MTDAMAGRGGVGIRLFVSGGEVVKRTFDQVGAAGKKMWAEIALGPRSANPAIRALSLGVGEAKNSIVDFAGRAGPAGVALGAFGAAGVATAASLAALAVALGQTREAMRFADEIDDAANQLGVGTTALQQYRYAMIAVGGAASDADEAIGAFTRKLGEAQAGSERALNWFQRLGFSREQLQSYDSAEAALADVIDRLAGLENETERQAVASKIGLGPMIALAREGREGVVELMQAAVDLGYVMDEELVRQGAEANQKFDEMSTIIDVQLKSAFVGLGPVLLELGDFLVYVADKIADVAESWRQLEDRSTRGLRRQDERLAAQQMELLEGRTSPDDLRGFDRRAWDSINAARGRIAAELADRGREGPPRPQGNDLEEPGDRPTTRTSRSRAAAEAERRQRDRERALDQLQRAELEAQRAAINARFGPGGTEESRTQLALANVTLELETQNAARDALRAQLEKAGALDAAAQARLEELRIAQQENAAARDRAILEEERLDLAERRLRQEEVEERDAIALLDIQAQMAGTAQERYEIGRRILEAEQALERKLLDAQLQADRTLSPEDRKRQWAGLTQRQAGELTLFDFDETERLREQFKGYGREVVQAIEDGRIGEYIGEKIKERLLDGALDTLFNMLSGGGGKAGGGGGWLSGLVNVGVGLLTGGGSAANIKIGRAAGGGVRPGFVYDVAEHGRPELLLLGGQGQVTSAAETAKMVRDLAGPGGGPSGSMPAPMITLPPITINAQGADPAGLARVERAVERLNETLEQRAVDAVAEYQQRTHRGF